MCNFAQQKAAGYQNGREKATWRPAGKSVMMIGKRLLLFLCLLTTAVCGSAQHKPQVEAMCGVDLSYRDVNFLRLYDYLINLTPSVKWHMGHDWLLAAQGYIPIANYGYSKNSSKVRMSIATLSKQLHLGSDQHFKVSTGFFTSGRYGLDVRWMYPINSWLMVQARGGYTGHWQMVGKSRVDKPDKVTATAGVNVFLRKWNTEARLIGGRYLYEDWGIEGDIYRHFRHTSVGLFARRHNPRSTYIVQPHKFSGGFRIVIMLPPYKKSDKKFRARLLNNFHTSYIAQSDEYSMVTYRTDPEENERTNAIDVEWGSGTIDTYNYGFGE
jgi:hypothetical protein